MNKHVKKQTSSKDTVIRIVLILLIAVLLGVFAFAAYKLYTIQHEYKESERKYDSVATQFTTEQSKKPKATAAPQEEDVGPKSPVEVDFGPLLEQCPDIVGWIYSENTVINYPLVRGADNDYYLHRFIDGSYNGGGTIFMDFKNYGDFSDPNSIFYGHHMNDGSMFASLSKYREEGYYEEHPVLYINTPTQNYRVDVFAGYVCDADSDTYRIGFDSDEDFLNYVERMRSQSDFSTDVEIQPGDHLVTLSTCSYEWYDARYVVQGKLVPIG